MRPVGHEGANQRERAGAIETLFGAQRLATPARDSRAHLVARAARPSTRGSDAGRQQACRLDSNIAATWHLWRLKTRGIYLTLTKLVASLLRGYRALRGKPMTTLEQALASILELIEKAKAAGNSLALATLMRRKQAICAALAAPEQH